MRRMIRKAKGFTLIELIIVILLVGIMAVVAIPKYVDLTTNAENAARNTGLGALKSAVAIHIAQNSGSWPTGDDLFAAVEGGTGCGVVGGLSAITIADISGSFPIGINSCTANFTSLGSITASTTS